MRSGLLVLAVMVLFLPIHGQKAANEEQGDQNATRDKQNPPSGATTTTTDVGQVAADSNKDGHTNQSSDYLHTLISANNVPNVALAVVGIVGIIIALCTLNWLKTQTTAIQRQATLMERQTTAMERQLSVPYRAYLAISEPEKPDLTKVTFPVENSGQIAAKITSIETEIIVQARGQEDEEVYRRVIKQSTGEMIVHGKAAAFGLVVYMPWIPVMNQTVLISASIEYEVGFENVDGSPKIDTLNFVRVYDGYESQWKVAYTYAEIDFRKNEEPEQGQRPS